MIEARFIIIFVQNYLPEAHYAKTFNKQNEALMGVEMGGKMEAKNLKKTLPQKREGSSDDPERIPEKKKILLAPEPVF